LGLGLEPGLEPALDEEEVPEAGVLEGGPISPPPEVDAYAPPARKRALRGVVEIAVVAVVTLAIGFFIIKPVISIAKSLLSSGPTPAEQLEALQTENTDLENQLTVYRALGSIKDILAVRNELTRRQEISTEVAAIETKIADRASIDDRLDQISKELDKTGRELLIQKGTLANVQKAVKQTEARNDYLMSSTRKHLTQIEEDEIKSEKLKGYLQPERIEKAEGAAWFSRDTQEGLDRTTVEALSSL